MGGSRSHSDFFVGKSSQNSPKPVPIFWNSIPCVFFLYRYTLLKCVSCYELSVLSMLVMGFQFFLGWGWVGGVSSIQLHFALLDFFNFAKPLSRTDYPYLTTSRKQ